jgi:uncharacterized membrane protein HdeD (DUF308 family)
MDSDKQKQEISLIGRIFSLEALLILMGIFCLISGVVTGEATQIFWGVMIVAGAFVLHFVRKKDWKKHWEEQERLKALYEMKERENKEREREHGDKL